MRCARSDCVLSATFGSAIVDSSSYGRHTPCWCVNDVRIIPCSLQEPGGDVKVGHVSGGRWQRLTSRYAASASVAQAAIHAPAAQGLCLGSRSPLQDEEPRTEQRAQQPSHEDTPLL